MYKSKFERTFASLLTKHRLPFEYEPDRFVLYMPTPGRCPSCPSKTVEVKRTYTPDFKINGHYIETKGKFTSKDRTKILTFIRQYPSVSFRMFFMRDNKIAKGSTQTYTMWCKKHGIKCAVGTVPSNWYKELRKP